MYLVFVFPKGQYESKYASESDSMKKVEKQNYLNIIPRAKDKTRT